MPLSHSWWGQTWDHVYCLHYPVSHGGVGVAEGSHLPVTSTAPPALPLPQRIWPNPLPTPTTTSWLKATVFLGCDGGSADCLARRPARTHLTPPPWAGLLPGPRFPPFLDYDFPEGFATGSECTMGDSKVSLLCSRPQRTTKVP